MTSNLGSQWILELGVDQREELERRIEEALRLHFRPEFLNRLDEIVIFHSLTREQLREIVDLGVCYFNLGDTAAAEKLFQLALARDPNQPVALFNLGIVSQQRGDHKTALGYLHRALMSNPPEEMKKSLMDAMQRSFQASGATPPPIPEGR